MKIRQFYDVFRKSYDLNRRSRAAFEQGRHLCEACGHTSSLKTLTPLTIFPCPACGFKGLVPAVYDEYLLFEPLGAGGVSSVYKAVRRDDARHVFAVKILRTDREIDAGLLREFLFEADVHRTVGDHPAIATFFEQRQCQGAYYHVMEFVPGDSIKRRVETFGRIPEREALMWTRAVAGALRHILDHGYLYRDISPGNILIRADNSVCLIDFGLVLPREEADQSRPDRPVAGTPEYMAPERIQQAGEDERSSIYSLGMVLFFMLKGEPMIKAGSHERAALQHVSAVRVAFNERMLPEDCSPEVITLIKHMIKYDPVDRPDSLSVLETKLDELINRA
ncbi:MAG TPA: serine/threonine-protein kinase [Kiritimatiellia bacterium]|nr:serine/threonine-protein kinase [Kiritimatiellia bacterium]HMO98953.1 serine/threonine-protein kinase [Kiritimatiellia bacterium]HMP95715.1 serine/threonine-protein kinase [Kiritimatiellia bacterium]